MNNDNNMQLLMAKITPITILKQSKKLKNAALWFLFVIMNILFTSNAFSQSQIVFDKTYNQGVSMQAVWPTSDNGYIAGGYYKGWDTVLNDWNYDHYILKVDSVGATQWEEIIDITVLDGGCIEGITVRELSDGGFAYISTINCAQNPPSPLSKYLLIRLDSNGDTLWTETYERPKRSMGQWVDPTADGGFIMTGYAADYGTSADVYIVKADSLGKQEWSKSYQLYGEDQAACVRQTSDGGYIVAAGSSHAYALARTWLMKLNDKGDTLWTKVFPWGMWNINAYLEITPDNGFIVAVKDSNTYQVAFKTDSLGNLLWSKNFGKGNACISQTQDNGFALFGLNYLTLVDSNGFTIQTISNNIHPTFWQNTPDNGYITAVENRLYKTDCVGNYLFWDSLSCSTTNIGTHMTDLLKDHEVVIYPNPSTGKITINAADVQLIQIVNSVGKLIDQYKPDTEKFSINLSEQTNGLYFIKLIGKKSTLVKKIVLNK